MKETVRVNGYNIADMRAKDWNFYAAGRAIDRKMALQAMHIGIEVTAELK